MVARLGGVVLIGVACLVLGIMAAVGGLSVPGTARIPAGAVVPGACIGPVDSPYNHMVRAGAGEGEQSWETTTYAYPVAVVVACDRPHAGEVLSVDYGAEAPTAATMPQLNDWDAGCQKQVDTGITGRGVRRILDRGEHWFIYWSPDIGATGQVVGPDQSARTAGESWSACVLLGPDGATFAGGDGPLPGECLSVGSVADLMGTGDDGAAAIGDPRLRVPCSMPHPAQILAYTDSIGGTPAEDVMQQSCETAARTLMGVEDPSAGGSLRIAVLSDTYPVCLVLTTGGARLVDSVLGIGDRPLPWAG